MLARVQHVHGRQHSGRLGGDRDQHSLQPLDQRLDGGRVEHVGAELHRAADAGGITGGSPAFAQREGQVHPGNPGVRRQRCDLQITQGQPGGDAVLPREVLPGQYHLYQRVVGQASGRVEPLHEQLEGHVLVLVGGQTARPHLIQRFGEARVAGQVDPQHQGVDKKAHQSIECGIIAPGDRESDRHVAAGGHLGQQYGQGGLDHHEAGRVVLPGHRAHPLLQLGRPLHHDAGAAVVGHGRIGPVGGQCQALGQPGQLLLPVRQLGGDRAVAVGDLTELRTLPQRVIGVLHRQRRPTGCLPRTPAGVRHRQISHQRRHRQAVGGDVVHHGHQHVFVVGDAEKPCPQRNLGGQIERVTHRRVDGLLQPGFRPAGGIDDLPTEVGLLDRDNHLFGYPVDRREEGAQGLLAGYHIGERRP